MSTEEEAPPAYFDEVFSADTPSIAKPFCALIRDRGMEMAGFVAAHWWGAERSAIERFSCLFAEDRRQPVAMRLVSLAPRSSPYFEILLSEIDAITSATWIIDAIFSPPNDEWLHTQVLLETCHLARGGNLEKINHTKACQFLREWRREVRRQFLGSCLDWIEL